jgi:hypothetical protein
MVWTLAFKGGPADFKYKQLSSYTLPGYTKGYGMTFLHPQQLEAGFKDTATLSNQVFVHNKTLPTKKIVTISVEAAAVSYIPQHADFPASYFDDVNKALTTPTDKSYSAFRQPLSVFVRDNINKRFTYTLGKTTQFSSSNLKNRAWWTEFTAVDKKPKNNYSPTRMNGGVMLAISQKGYYYLMIATANDNWKSNQGVWQQVLNSIKVDQ